MAKDHHIDGLSTEQMVEVTQSYRNVFDINDIEHVDMLDILEFKMPKLYPGFKFVILRDQDLDTDASMSPSENRIYMKASVYRRLAEGDPKSRFTAAHELGHFLLHRKLNATMHKSQNGYEQGITGLKSNESVEPQADMFARHFLAPPKISYKFKSNPLGLSKIAGIPMDIALGNITISKRTGLLIFR